MEKGFTCECGKFHEFGVWVAAHWRERLVHTCDSCGNVHSVCMGYATLDKPKRRKKRGSK